MKINISLPFDQTEKPDEFLTPDAIVEVAQHAERLGYDGGNVTDHPCPTGRWLDSGGHHAHDPFVLLSFVAAATTTFRLQRSEEHTSELQALLRISYAVFRLHKKNTHNKH